jgi:hypothetical protein
MADTSARRMDLDREVMVKLHDNGDGTFSEVGYGGAAAAGEAHLGSVGGESASVLAPLTVSTSAYSIGHNIGGLLTLAGAVRTSGGKAVLQSIFVADKSNVKAALEILLFAASPAATFTDRAAFPTLAQADTLLTRRRISIAATDYVTVGGSAFAEIGAIGKLVKPTTGTSLFAAVLINTAVTYANAADLQLIFGFLQD